MSIIETNDRFLSQIILYLTRIYRALLTYLLEFKLSYKRQTLLFEIHVAAFKKWFKII
jgi:hypothetical protein